MAKKLVDGQRVKITVQHGAVTREISGRLRRFETDSRYDILTGEQTVASETRWEVVNAREDRSSHGGYEPTQVVQSYDAVGIDPENVVSVEPLT